MRFFDFLESKYTMGSLTNKADHFSMMRDGEQKATQAYLALFRFVFKWFMFLWLPIEYTACMLGLKETPRPAKEIIEKMTKEAKDRAELLKASSGQGKLQPVN